MKVSNRLPRRIAIGQQPTIPAAAEEAQKISRYLLDHGIEQVLCAPLTDEAFQNNLSTGHFDLLIALGGDGTMLRAGRLCAPLGLPMLGINLGHFGFLTEVSQQGWPAKMPALLEGRFRLEERMMLSAEHFRGEQSLGKWTVLNEVVICRGQVVRPVQLKADVNDYPLASYVADGLIVSTPTGSTAYSLAVGGPILPPDLRAILIVAVAPHLSMDRAVVLSEDSRVKVTVNTTHQAVLSIDGQPPIMMQDGDHVMVASLPENVHFIRFENHGYFYRNLSAYMEQNPTTRDSE